MDLKLGNIYIFKFLLEVKCEEYIDRFNKRYCFFIINGWRKFIYLICSCFKIDNKKVFVNYFDGRGIGDHPKYIVKELIKECPNIKIYWVYRGKKKHRIISYL